MIRRSQKRKENEKIVKEIKAKLVKCEERLSQEGLGSWVGMG